MFLQINPSNGVPVYEQVANQVSFLVADRTITPGQLIPSVRQLAKELAINPNTVARAYRELQSHEILLTVRGTGIQVAKDAYKFCKARRTDYVRNRFTDVITEARQSQLGDGEIVKVFESEMKRKRTTSNGDGQ